MSVRLRSKRLVSSSLSTDRSESEKKDFEKACQCCDKKKRFAIFKDLGVLEYRKALELQTQTVEAIQSKTKTLPCSLPDQNNNQETIFFVEHPTVYTLGKRGGLENLSVSPQFLKSKNIEIVKTNRGGNITWHGPGQAVLYPVIDLKKNKIAVKDFVYGLEEVMKLTLNNFNINAQRDRKNHGIWVGDSKIGSIGLSIKKGVSMHGLALNINPDLKPFSWIKPCGLNNIAMTSIEKEISGEKEKNCQKEISNLNNIALTGSSECSDVSMEKIKDCFKRYFSLIFNFKIIVNNE